MLATINRLAFQTLLRLLWISRLQVLRLWFHVSIGTVVTLLKFKCVAGPMRKHPSDGALKHTTTSYHNVAGGIHLVTSWLLEKWAGYTEDVQEKLKRQLTGRQRRPPTPFQALPVPGDSSRSAATWTCIQIPAPIAHGASVAVIRFQTPAMQQTGFWGSPHPRTHHHI